jgi:5-methyltetrahydropteroyltriglutamate--homocysteine methyltransferase
MADDFRYHIDHHGSLVRPPELLAARAGGDPLALAAAEDQAVIAVAHLQRLPQPGRTRRRALPSAAAGR